MLIILVINIDLSVMVYQEVNALENEIEFSCMEILGGETFRLMTKIEE